MQCIGNATTVTGRRKRQLTLTHDPSINKRASLRQNRLTRSRKRERQLTQSKNTKSRELRSGKTNEKRTTNQRHSLQQKVLSLPQETTVTTKQAQRHDIGELQRKKNTRKTFEKHGFKAKLRTRVTTSAINYNRKQRTKTVPFRCGKTNEKHMTNQTHSCVLCSE